MLAEATPSDGVFKVIESWKGNLIPGDQLTVPELIPPTDAASISHYPKQTGPIGTSVSGLGDKLPRQPAGSRMVLFLKRHTPEASYPKNLSTVSGWHSSDLLNDMKASVVWIDGAQLYRFVQVLNPGPSVLTAWEMPLAKVKERVAEIDGLQRNLAEAVSVTDGGTRAERLRPYVATAVFPAQQYALEELGKCGPSALPTIREMLDDPSFFDEGEDLIEIYIKTGGETVGKELNTLLEQELSFWQSTGPSLAMGWWNQDPSVHAPLRQRYDQTLKLILGLEHTHYAPALNTAAQLRDLWRSLPQLNDPSGLDQMARDCDELIARLQGK